MWLGNSWQKLPDHEGWNKKHPVFNEKLLKLYKNPIYEEQKDTANPPGPVEPDNKEEYEVEKIERKAEVFNTWSNRKDTRMLKTHGNRESMLKTP